MEVAPVVGGRSIFQEMAGDETDDGLWDDEANKDALSVTSIVLLG